MWVVLLRFQWWLVRISFERMVHNSIRIQFVHTNFVTRYKIAVSPFSSPLVNPRHSLRDFVYHDGQNVPSRTSLLLLCSLEARSLHALLLIFQVFSEMSRINILGIYKAYKRLLLQSLTFFSNDLFHLIKLHRQNILIIAGLWRSIRRTRHFLAWIMLPKYFSNHK